MRRVAGYREARHGGLRHELNAVYALWIREFKVFQREKSRVVSSLATPFLWILLVGTGFAATTRFAADSQYASVNYTHFLFPGVIAQAILFQTVFYGLYIVWDRKLDVLKEVLVAPVSRTSIFFGKVVGGSTESLLQSVIMFSVGLVFFRVPVAGVLKAIPFVLALAIGFVALGLFIGSFFESLEGFNVVVSFLLFPVFFVSGALYPVENLPAWLDFVARANPVTYAVDGLRGSLIGIYRFGYFTDLAVIAGFAVLAIAAGTWAFQRMR